MIPLIGIDYTEYDPVTYAGCTLTIGDLNFTLDTGNPDQDFRTICGLLKAIIPGLEEWAMLRSSVDHFIMDGGNLSL